MYRVAIDLLGTPKGMNVEKTQGSNRLRIMSKSLGLYFKDLMGRLKAVGCADQDLQGFGE